MGIWLNRTLCDVLNEMRDCHKTRNYSYLPGLIEEAQAMANRMESALTSIKDIKRMESEFLDMRHEYNELNAEIKRLKSEREKLKNEGEDS